MYLCFWVGFYITSNVKSYCVTYLDDFLNDFLENLDFPHELVIPEIHARRALDWRKRGECFAPCTGCGYMPELPT